MKPTTRKTEFDLMHDKYEPLVMKAIRLKIKSEATAKDICQDVFIKVFKHLNTYDASKAQFGTWIVTIAENTAIDYLRKENAESQRFEDVDIFVKDTNDTSEMNNFFIAHESSDKNIDRNDLKGNIAKAFNNLTPKQREIAVLYFKQNLPYKDIANVLEIPMNTAKNLIFRVKEVLQSSLKYEYQLIQE